MESIEEMLAPRGSTYITPAIMMGLKEADLAETTRSTIILLTDGEDSVFNAHVELSAEMMAKTPVVDTMARALAQGTRIPDFYHLLSQINHYFIVFGVGMEVDFRNLSRFASFVGGSFHLLPNPETLPQDLAIVLAKIFETVQHNALVSVGTTDCYVDNYASCADGEGDDMQRTLSSRCPSLPPCPQVHSLIHRHSS